MNTIREVNRSSERTNNLCHDESGNSVSNNQMKILVVDDSLVMRKLLTHHIKEAKLGDVDGAQNGLEALNLLNSNTYGLILLDWNMPEMNGFDTLVKIREMGITTPIVMVTTESEKSKVVEAMKAGVDNYVIKPFKKNVLITKLLNTLNY